MEGPLNETIERQMFGIVYSNLKRSKMRLIRDTHPDDDSNGYLFDLIVNIGGSSAWMLITIKAMAMESAPVRWLGVPILLLFAALFINNSVLVGRKLFRRACNRNPPERSGSDLQD